MPRFIFEEKMIFRGLDARARYTWPCNPFTELGVEEKVELNDDEKKCYEKDEVSKKPKDCKKEDGPGSRGFGSALVGHDIDKNYYLNFLTSWNDCLSQKLKG